MPLRTHHAVVAGATLLAALASAAPRRSAAQGAPRPVGAGAAGSVAAAVDSLAEAYLRAGRSPGVSIAVVRARRDTLVFRGYGLADLENDVPATERTVYRVGSVTKQFTAALVMRMVERGRLSLDDSLGALLPGAPTAWRGVRLRQLLNHTSGIPSYTNVGQRWRRRMREDLPPDSLVAFTARDTFDFRPGTKWSYDNTGYVLLGMILERATGRPYARLLDEQLFAPLGLADTRYCDTGPIIKRRAGGYERAPDGSFVNSYFISMTQPFSAGSLCSTVGDLARWNALLHTGKVVSAASYARMTTPEGGALKAPMSYGYGLVADTLAGHRMITHGGAINGFSSANAYFPDDSLSVTVLSNAGASDPTSLMKAIAREVLRR